MRGKLAVFAAILVFGSASQAAHFATSEAGVGARVTVVYRVR